MRDVKREGARQRKDHQTKPPWPFRCCRCSSCSSPSPLRGGDDGAGPGVRIAGDEYVTPELSTSVLCADPSDPCRAARDAPAVAALAARLAVRNATATKVCVEAALAAHAGNATVAKGIESCVQLYAGVVAILQRAAQFVGAGRYHDAREVLDAADPDMLIAIPGRCEAMAGDAALLPRENHAFTYMALVVHAIIKQVPELLALR